MGDTVKAISNAMGRNTVFRRFSQSDFDQVYHSMSKKVFKAGEVVVQQGDEGKDFFLIEDGEASVWQGDPNDQDKVSVLAKGDHFGEQAIIKEAKRNATVMADTKLACLLLNRNDFVKLNIQEKVDYIKRRAVGGNLAEVKVCPPDPKTEEDTAFLRKALSANKALQTIFLLSHVQVSQLIAFAWKLKIPIDSQVITQGDTVADYLYVVKEGAFDVAVDGRTICRGVVGDIFGELALIYQAPRASTVTAVEDSVVWVIDRMNFKNILMADSKAKRYVTYIDCVETLRALTQEQKDCTAEAFIERKFQKGETIITQGEIGKHFYLLYDGDVDFFVDGKKVQTCTASEQEGTADYFGERALLHNEPRAATVVCVSAEAKVLSLDQSSFNILAGETHIFPKPKRHSAEHIMKKDLKRLTLLGCGGFGYVELMAHKKTHRTYALKTLSKGFVVSHGMKENVMNEKSILMMLDSPFIISCYETYNSRAHLHFLLEPALGGELYDVYMRNRLYGKLAHARFYAAGVVIAFEHMHSRHVVYRDLKPENLLITARGQPKVADMGLAKCCVGKTYTSAGTPDYMAPEVIGGEGHSFPVDWWTLGILIFECLASYPPFEAETPMQIFQNMKLGITKVAFPKHIKADATLLIKSLLKADPSERLPMRKGGADNIKTCPWYTLGDGFDWTSMEAQTLVPPYLPPLAEKGQNFHASEVDKPPEVAYQAFFHPNWDKDFATVDEPEGTAPAMAICACCGA